MGSLPKLDPVLKTTLPKEATKAGGYLSRLHQFWLDAVALLTAMIESADAGELTVGDSGEAVAAVQSALVLMGNAHQKMAQERRKKVLLQLNPALKSLAEEEKAFQNAAPMLFGEEFAKRATDRVEAVKAIKKLSKPGEQDQHRRQVRNVFSITTPEFIMQTVAGAGTKRPLEEEPLPEVSRGRYYQGGSKSCRTGKLNLLMCAKSSQSIVQCTQLIRELSSIKRESSTIVHAGRISHFIQNWALITQDTWVLQAIQWFKLSLVGNPDQQQVPQEMHFPVEQEKLVTKEVARLIPKGLSA